MFNGDSVHHIMWQNIINSYQLWKKRKKELKNQT